MNKSLQLGVIKPTIIVVILLAIIFGTVVIYQNLQIKNLEEKSQDKDQIQAQLKKVEAQLKKLKSTDQIKRNDALEEEIKNIETTYKDSVNAYESILDLKASYPKADKTLDIDLAESINMLSERKFASAQGKLKELAQKVSTERNKYLATLVPATTSISGGGGAPAPANNNAPDNGYSRQTVKTTAGDFTVSIIAADLGSAKVIVDTASDENCGNNCPVLSLGDYAARSGAFAGVNGSYFCPADYPSCAGKTNSFDLLVMNKNKKYLNSDNNVYSTNPAAIFGNNYVRFVGAAQEWGRDIGVDGVISNFPLLVSGGNVVFGGDGDPKKGSKGARQFVANKGNKVYIGSVANATVAEAAIVLKTFGIENALNLDSGGSSALWFNGSYIIGPGRALPNSVLFVRK